MHYSTDPMSMTYPQLLAACECLPIVAAEAHGSVDHAAIAERMARRNG